MTQSHAPVLDAVPSSAEGEQIEVPPPPSADLAYAMHYLLSTPAFFLVPAETNPVPTPSQWPFAYVKRDRKEDRDRRLRAALSLGIVAELDQLARGKIRSDVIEEVHTDARGHKRQRNESLARLDDGEADQDNDGEDGPDQRERWSLEALRRARTAYVDSKAGGRGGSADHSKQSLLVSPTYQIQADILAVAKMQTRRAAEDLADDMSGLAAVARSAGDDGGGLLALLPGTEGHVPTPSELTTGHGLDAYQHAIEELLSDAM